MLALRLPHVGHPLEGHLRDLLGRLVVVVVYRVDLVSVLLHQLHLRGRVVRLGLVVVLLVDLRVLVVRDLLADKLEVVVCPVCRRVSVRGQPSLSAVVLSGLARIYRRRVVQRSMSMFAPGCRMVR